MAVQQPSGATSTPPDHPEASAAPIAPAGLEQPVAGYAETRQDLARRVPPAPSQPVARCPSCEWLDALAVHAFSDPEGCDRSSLTDVRVLRRRHLDSGECLAVSEGA